jgi:serine/threonine protein kinase
MDVGNELKNKYNIEILYTESVLFSVFSDRILLGLDKNKNKKVIIKKIKKNDKKEYVINEIKMLNSLNHKNIINILYSNVNLTCPYVIYPYYNRGDMFEYIKSKKSKPSDIVNICKSIINVLYFINITNGIIHRDIKLDNILLDDNLEPVLIDFEYAIKHEDNIQLVRCGSPEYASPEMLSGYPYTYKTDIWSFGVLLYIAMYKTYPFHLHINTFEQAAFFFRNNKKRKIILDNSKSPINYILKNTITYEPDTRMSHKEIEHYLNLYLLKF